MLTLQLMLTLIGYLASVIYISWLIIGKTKHPEQEEKKQTTSHPAPLLTVNEKGLQISHISSPPMYYGIDMLITGKSKQNNRKRKTRKS